MYLFFNCFLYLIINLFKFVSVNPRAELTIKQNKVHWIPHGLAMTQDDVKLW